MDVKVRNTSKLSEKDSVKFVAWLSLIKGFLPKNMTLEEAKEIFLRKRTEELSENTTNQGANSQ